MGEENTLGVHSRHTDHGRGLGLTEGGVNYGFWSLRKQKVVVQPEVGAFNRGTVISDLNFGPSAEENKHSRHLYQTHAEHLSQKSVITWGITAVTEGWNIHSQTIPNKESLECGNISQRVPKSHPYVVCRAEEHGAVWYQAAEWHGCGTAPPSFELDGYET